MHRWLVSNFSLTVASPNYIYIPKASQQESALHHLKINKGSPQIYLSISTSATALRTYHLLSICKHGADHHARIQSLLSSPDPYTELTEISYVKFGNRQALAST